MPNHELSSENLYHFKQDYKIIESILKNGFRHTKWNESIPYENLIQQNFIVCFCDIRIEDSRSHRACYGNNAIVLTKEWGINNGVSPVRYVHENSPGISQDYIQSKNRYRDIRQRSNGRGDDVLKEYVIFSVLKDSDKLKSDTFQTEINENPALLREMSELETEYRDIYHILTRYKKGNVLAKFLRSLINRIFELHNELERRDSYMRIYKDDFTQPANNHTIHDKILYEEKEWRSIKYRDISEKSDFLPVSYNLTFNEDDIVAILVEDKEKKDSLIQFLSTNSTLVNATKTIPKIEIITNFKE
ncbi:hypothetical protein EO244_11710 [Ancylomarina salipaludis]|uniref:DUF2971 domain-containing protein n=1 Tax=Ancylomarina salipaludis TaxID=2501299 RepID=A0A4Q1JKD2_9BACT|nr:abortive infection system antitoxin AbiGi family protein [Ancylomarina salipaludis]RXQ92208.1 hypothetical protein EO244_11710 [Ancylomarina salipaludis]